MSHIYRIFVTRKKILPHYPDLNFVRDGNGCKFAANVSTCFSGWQELTERWCQCLSIYIKYSSLRSSKIFSSHVLEKLINLEVLKHVKHWVKW